MDTTVMNCNKCGHETDCIQGLCQDCSMGGKEVSKMIFSIVNDKINDNVIVEGETIKECQAKTIDELTKRGWDMADCHSIDLTKDYEG